EGRPPGGRPATPEAGPFARVACDATRSPPEEDQDDEDAHADGSSSRATDVPSISRGPDPPMAGSTLQREASVRAVCNGPFISHGHSGQHRADNGERPRCAASSTRCPGLDGETKIFAVRDRR